MASDMGDEPWIKIPHILDWMSARRRSRSALPRAAIEGKYGFTGASRARPMQSPGWSERWRPGMHAWSLPTNDRQSVLSGKGLSFRLDLVGGRNLKKKQIKQ